MHFPNRDLINRLHAGAASAVQSLVDFAVPSPVPAVAGDLASGPADRRTARVAPPHPAPESAPERAAILADILVLTEELDRESRRAVAVTGSRRPRRPLAAAGCPWLEG